jgi:hypothetical protein
MTSIEAAISWLVALITGEVATILPMIAIAFVGYLCFAGRLPIVRAGSVILGTFLLFGASQMAAALVNLAGDEQAMRFQDVRLSTPQHRSHRELPDGVPRSPTPSNNPFDPYSGDRVVN